jgi:hypothetical protein
MQNLHRSFTRAKREITLVFVNPVKFDASHYPWLSVTDRFHCFYPHFETDDMEVVVYAIGARPGPDR